MKATGFLIPILILAVSSVVPPRLPAENASPTKEAARAEVRAEVPALDEFHHVIRTIWHDAWPNKDVKTLRECSR